MIQSHDAEGYYLIYPQQRAVLAYGPIIPGADTQALNEAHAYINEVGLGALTEVRYLFSDKSIIHSSMYMPDIGYGDVDIPNSHDGLVNIRKVELLSTSMNIQSQIIREGLTGVIDDELIDRLESLYRMKIPLSSDYVKLLQNNAVFGKFNEDGTFTRDHSKAKHTHNELQVHMDGWFLATNELEQNNNFEMGS